MDETKDPDVSSVPPAAYVAAGMVGLLGLGVVGWMIYRSRRRMSLVRRLRDALPARVKRARSG